MKSGVLIAMSGGVDSSVAALLLKQQGYHCTGAMMKLISETDQVEGGRTCCSLQDSLDAREVAFRLGIPFYVFQFTSAFREQVVERFVSAWLNGDTPNPCIDCNRYLKFGGFLHRARQLEHNYIATGHYARIESDTVGKRYLLRRGIDENKDQSYVLYSMTQEQLSHTLMPLGALHKAQVRALAQEHGLLNAAKKESQDICFVPDGDYAGFIEHHTGAQVEPGPFFDLEGSFLGTHRGLIRYTIGQRKGLGISASHPLYVCGKNTADNSVTLGPQDALYCNRLEAVDINLIAVEQLKQPIRVRAKIRYQQDAQPAIVEQISEGRLLVQFDQPQRAVTPGQAVVLYDGDIVVGGGTIQTDCVGLI